MGKDIILDDLQTAQEHSFQGSSPRIDPRKVQEWYIPQGVLRGAFTMEEIMEERINRGHFEFGMFNTLLGITDRRPVSIGFSDIDKKTGMTTRDPGIIGLWDSDQQKIVPIGDRDLDELTKQAYEIHKGLGVDLHLRESKTAGEGPTHPSEQKA